MYVHFFYYSYHIIAGLSQTSLTDYFSASTAMKFAALALFYAEVTCTGCMVQVHLDNVQIRCDSSWRKEFHIELCVYMISVFR